MKTVRINVQKNNKSGFNGVWFRKNRGRWIADFRNVFGQNHKTKSFKTPEEAWAWRKEFIEKTLGIKFYTEPRCRICKKRKDKSAFWKDKTRAFGVCAVCKDCSIKKSSK